ncbi:MAG: serine hydrolase [Crocinitomicaceae bacterium]
MYCLFGVFAFGQISNAHDSLYRRWLGIDPLVDKVLNNQEEYKLQIQLSISQDDNSITTKIGNENYYYPASLVKFPTVLAVVHKLLEEGLSLDDKIVLDDVDIKGNKSFIRKTEKGISFKELIEKALVVSDNDYYNVLYHFIGPAYLNDYLKKRGFEDVLIYRCFNGCSKEEQLKTAGYSVYSSTDSLILKVNERLLSWEEISNKFAYSDDKRVGDRFIKKGKVIMTPYDFNENLEIPINSLHKMMITFISDSADLKWNIGETQRSFVLEKLRQHPADIGEKDYSVEDFKIIGFGNQKMDNSRFTTYSKIGYSYGFITETAYVVDELSNESFFLTISMYVNSNNTINDGRYQYNSIATPFMGTLTHIIADQLIDK